MYGINKVIWIELNWVSLKVIGYIMVKPVAPPPPPPCDSGGKLIFIADAFLLVMQ